jgi:hypothetical protein
MNVQELSDWLEITEVLSSYCHAVDQRDWIAMADQVFTADATLDFSAFGGPNGVVSEVAPKLAASLQDFVGTQHTVSTVKISLEGDLAKVRSAAIVSVTLDARGQEQSMLNGVWYDDEMVRTPLGWRISSRSLVRAWGPSALTRVAAA